MGNRGSCARRLTSPHPSCLKLGGGRTNCAGSPRTPIVSCAPTVGVPGTRRCGTFRLLVAGAASARTPRQRGLGST